MRGQTVIGWGQHKTDTSLKHHAIIALNDGGSVKSACKGRWSIHDAWAWFAGPSVIVYPRCGACVDFTNAQLDAEGLPLIERDHPRARAKVGDKFDLGGEA